MIWLDAESKQFSSGTALVMPAGLGEGSHWITFTATDSAELSASGMVVVAAEPTEGVLFVPLVEKLEGK